MFTRRILVSKLARYYAATSIIAGLTPPALSSCKTYLDFSCPRRTIATPAQHKY